jgi:peptide/nickel transport system permease protein
MGTLRYLISRLFQGAALVLAVVVLNFALVHAAPGDPVETIAGASGGMSEELQAELRSRYGLDKPLPVQLGIYLRQVLSGDLGYSYFFNLPVSDMIAERVPATLLLVVTSVLGLQFGNVMAGAIVVETVFNWPGLGRLAFESVLRRDYPTLLGVLFFSSLVVVVMNQVTDLCYRLIDPRIKTS